MYSAFSSESPEQVAAKFTRYGDFKSELAALIIESLSPIQDRYTDLMGDRAELENLMRKGAQKASVVSAAVYDRAATAMGLN